MSEFMGRDFLLESETAKRLYHTHAAGMPVVDYHCHISPREIYENHRFADLAEAWLGGDHYKWRLMRAAGVEERCVTGDASGWEKFSAFAAVLPRAAGNPVYHWAHLELQRYFDCYTPLSPATAQEIWQHCNRLLQTEDSLRVRGVIRRSNVTALCTTDDPVDSLEWHQKLREDGDFAVQVYPAFRTDKVLNVEKAGFAAYAAALGQAAGTPVADLAALKTALCARMDHFAAMGCRASDQGVDAVSGPAATVEQAGQTLAAALAGQPVPQAEADAYRAHLLDFLGEEYAKRGWVMEVHFGAMRNVNGQGFAALGPDTGYDCISPAPGMGGLAALLNGLDARGALPKTLVFSLNPADNAAINTLAGCFQQAGVAGRVQQGAAWWFNDTLPGMTDQMTSFASLQPLGNFVGMLTDSRSFFSYTRHEYFRRILCNLLGGWVQRGLYPADMDTLGAMVRDISYNNAAGFFGFASPA